MNIEKKGYCLKVYRYFFKLIFCSLYYLFCNKYLFEKVELNIFKEIIIMVK